MYYCAKNTKKNALYISIHDILITARKSKGYKINRIRKEILLRLVVKMLLSFFHFYLKIVFRPCEWDKS